MNHDWMANDKVDILRHLPEFLRKDGQFKGVNDADSDEHNKMRLVLQDLLDQLFVESATWGLSRWEELLAIENTEGKSDKERRKEIIIRLQQPGSVTDAFMQKLVNQFISDAQGTVLSFPSEYRIEILYNGGTVIDYKQLRDAIELYIPAHIGYKLVTRTLGNLYFHGAGNVQLYREIFIDMTTNARQQVDDSLINNAGREDHSYKSILISGGQ